MKTLAALLIASASASAIASPLMSPDKVWTDNPPTRIEQGGAVLAVSDGWLIGNGWSVPTEEETLAHDAEIQQAAIDAELAQQAANEPRYKAENAFLLRAAQISAQFGVDLSAADSYQSAIYKLKEATQGERIDRLEAGIELRTLWDVVLFHGGKWGEVQWHPEIEN